MLAAPLASTGLSFPEQHLPWIPPHQRASWYHTQDNSGFRKLLAHKKQQDLRIFKRHSKRDENKTKITPLA